MDFNIVNNLKQSFILTVDKQLISVFVTHTQTFPAGFISQSAVTSAGSRPCASASCGFETVDAARRHELQPPSLFSFF